MSEPNDYMAEADKIMVALGEDSNKPYTERQRWLAHTLGGLIESRLSPRPEMGRDAGVLSAEDFALEAAHIIATWDSTDWEGNLIALIKSRDAALLASQGHGDGTFPRQPKGDGDGGWTIAFSYLKQIDKAIDDLRNQSPALISFDDWPSLESIEAVLLAIEIMPKAHPQPDGLREAKELAYEMERCRGICINYKLEGGDASLLLESINRSLDRALGQYRAALAQSEREGE